jgi:hypothetical protein
MKWIIYIYIYIYIYGKGKFHPIRFVVLPSSTYLFTAGVEGSYFSLDHTETHTTVGRTPLDEGSARRRDLYLTTQTLYKRQTSMPVVGFEPTIPASARPRTYTLDRAATEIGDILCVRYIIVFVFTCTPNDHSHFRLHHCTFANSAVTLTSLTFAATLQHLLKVKNLVSLERNIYKEDTALLKKLFLK